MLYLGYFTLLPCDFLQKSHIDLKTRNLVDYKFYTTNVQQQICLREMFLLNIFTENVYTECVSSVFLQYLLRNRVDI